MPPPNTVHRTTDAFQPDPPTNKYLWHVMGRPGRATGLQKLETFLKGGLWLARLDRFDENFEGSIPNANLGLLAKSLPANQVPQAIQEYRLGAKRAYASCWHMNDADPDNHVWNEFGSPVDGVAIRTTADSLRQQLAAICGPNGPVYFGKVVYLDHYKGLVQDGNVIAASFAVRKDFIAEREARILIFTHGGDALSRLYGQQGLFGPLIAQDSSASGSSEFIGGYDGGRAIVVRIRPQDLIHEILIDPRVAIPDRNRIVQLVENYNLGKILRA